MQDARWKTPAELSDDDMRVMLAFLLGRQQELELVLAQALMLLLSGESEVPEPTDDEYQYTIESLKLFLAGAYTHLRNINAASDKLQAEMASRN